MSDSLTITMTVSVKPRTVYDVCVERATAGGSAWGIEFAKPVATCDTEHSASEIKSALLRAERDKYVAAKAPTPEAAE